MSDLNKGLTLAEREALDKARKYVDGALIAVDRATVKSLLGLLMATVGIAKELADRLEAANAPQQ